MKTVDFANVMVQLDLGSDKKTKVDLTKELGNTIYKDARDLDKDTLARKIYDSTGPIEISDENAEFIKETYIPRLPYCVQRVLLEQL